MLAGSVLAGAARAQPDSAPIGTARMEPDGTIVLDLMAREGAMVGQGRVVHPPRHSRYEAILRHLGGQRAGEAKQVPHFP